MNAADAPLPPLEQHTQPVKKHSGLGIASLVIGIIGGLAIFALFAVAGFMQIRSQGGMDEKSPAVMLIGLGVIALCMVHLLGLGLGIAGLFQGDRRKAFPLIGVLINAVILTGTIGLIILGSAMK